MVTDILTVAQISAADRAAVAAGVPLLALMEAAGWAVARRVQTEARRQMGQDRHRRWPIVLLCGAGNNGGDGFVAARVLHGWGWPVRVASVVPVERLRGEAAVMAQRWLLCAGATVEPLSLAAVAGAGLVVDALLGAGLSRPLDGLVRQVVEAVAAQRTPVVAVDVPSGLHGDTGEVWGGALACVATVTFFRPKLAHCLSAGRALCGVVEVADIGIPPEVLPSLPLPPEQARLRLNDPALWEVPPLGAASHKYSRGHALVIGSAAMSGAGRLALAAARRSGVGVVTVAAPASALPLYAVDAPGALLWPLREEEDANADVQGLRQVLADPRRSAVAVGMGAGLREATRQQVLTVLASGKAVVLDAEALTCFAADPAPLLAALHAPTRGPVVMTPHAGEFARLFAPLGIGRQAGEAHWQQALAAARLCRAVVVLKGADTVIADPRGEVVLSSMAPPTLATAGAGDVLAGLVVGELAQGLDAFSAACAAVWHHSLWARRADQARGRALLAEDLLAFGSEDLGGPYAS